MQEVCSVYLEVPEADLRRIWRCRRLEVCIWRCWTQALGAGGEQCVSGGT